MNDEVLPAQGHDSRLSHAPRSAAGERGPESHLEELLERLQEHRPAKSRFEVVRRIARGGMGVVLEVWDQDLRRRLAMKSLQSRPKAAKGTEAEALMRERLLTRFLEEAQVTGQLGHPGIVPLHEMGLDDEGRPFFTMPLVRGRTLAQISEEYRAGKPPWTLSRLLAVLQKVCEAVAYAHSKGVIHRDLKPANIMVGRFGETYVMDWGLARVLGRPDAHDLRLRVGKDLTDTLVQTDRAEAHLVQGDSPILTMDGDVIGTPAYMPPEQAEGRIEDLGPRSDVYALGAILYSLLVGRDPYAPAQGTASAREVLTRVLLGSPPPIVELEPNAPPDLVAIAECAMAREPERRYANAIELAEELAAFRESRPVQVTTPSPGKLLRLWVERHRAVARTIAVAVGVLFAAAVLFVWRLDGAHRSERVARTTSEARADVLLARDLLAREPQLYPASPERRAGLASWVDDARSLLGRRQARSAALVSAAEDLGASFRRDLAQVRAQLPRVEERLATAEDLRRSTVDAHAEAWRRAIAETRASPHYAGLEIEPQVGLIPLGADPTSGLQEFHHALSGARPAGEPGAWEVSTETGLVLVLLPRGEYWMGSPDEEVGRHPGNEPRHRAEVAAFFCSKFEVTQAQWRRSMGDNPARYQPELMQSYPSDETHPVDSVSWYEVQTFASRVDLRMPTEVEWEYAARAGSSARTYAGAAVPDLQRIANVLDASARPSFEGGGAWEDGFRYHAPVGSFAANDFGLHDMLGNVLEWCADRYWLYPGATEEPIRESGDARPLQRILRGGSWYHAPSRVRCARREVCNPRAVAITNGARLVRSLEPD